LFRCGVEFWTLKCWNVTSVR